MSQSSTLFIGMDVHQETIAVASIAQDHGAEVTYLGTMGTRQCDSDQRIRQMPSQATQLILIYEARPGGDWLYR
jgi:transposase